MPKIHQRRIFRTHPLDEYENLIYNKRRSGCPFSPFSECCVMRVYPLIDKQCFVMSSLTVGSSEG